MAKCYPYVAHPPHAGGDEDKESNEMVRAELVPRQWWAVATSCEQQVMSGLEADGVASLFPQGTEVWPYSSGGAMGSHAARGVTLAAMNGDVLEALDRWRRSAELPDMQHRWEGAARPRTTPPPSCTAALSKLDRPPRHRREGGLGLTAR